MTADYDEVLQRLHKQLVLIAGEDREFDETTDLVDGLGLDSFKVLDLLLEVEDEFDVSVPMNLLADVRTVRDLARCIVELGPESQ